MDSQTSYTLYELMITVVNNQHKDPMNPSIVKTKGCNHGSPQEVLEHLLNKLSSSRQENEGPIKSHNCVNRSGRRHLTSTS